MWPVLPQLNGVALTNYLSALPRVAPAGDRFNYNTAESNLVGEVLRSAIGMSAAPYLSQKIWQPMGMEYDATWLLSLPSDRETGGCCISATLRDYARLGLLALADGVLPDGTRVVPEGWMAASTTPSKGYDGYGYKWWLYGDGPLRRARCLWARRSLSTRRPIWSWQPTVTARRHQIARTITSWMRP
jgi:CubicO group peptidase (beta-lactamase class C family)